MKDGRADVGGHALAFLGLDQQPRPVAELLAPNLVHLAADGADSGAQKRPHHGRQRTLALVLNSVSGGHHLLHGLGKVCLAYANLFKVQGKLL